MFGKLKQYATKKLIQSKMKDVPADQQAMVMELVDNNPALLEKVSKEIKAEMKQNGNNETAAAMKIFPKYQAEIAAAMSPEMREKMMRMQGAPTAGKFNPNGSIRN